MGVPKNLWIRLFSDPVSHFGAPWQPFWILQAVRRCRRCGVAGGAGLQAVWRCRHWGVAGCERVSLAPLGWYLGHLLIRTVP